MARKTVRKKSCASKRAYKSSGRCVPKAKKASTKSRGCWARTREQAQSKMRTYGKRRKALRTASAVRKAKRGDFTFVKTHPMPQLFGLGRRRRRHGRR